MPITELVNWKEKDALICVINYANEEEVIEFARHVAQQTDSGKILLSVTANKWSENGRAVLEQGLEAVPLDIVLYDPGENLGYLNGTIFGYRQLRNKRSFAPKWIAVSNTDITFLQEDFFRQLCSRQYDRTIGCVAPSAYVPSTGAFENPRYVRRFTAGGIQKRIRIFSSLTLFTIQQKLGAIKAGLSRGAEKPSQYVYLAHGCCFFLAPEVANALCDTPFGTLLYSEELYVAEMGISVGKRVFYDETLKLQHNENAVTGKLGNQRRAGMYVDSLGLILRQFYHQNPCERPYTAKDVCAVIVCYQDASKIADNAKRLQQDGATVLVVDNGSGPETLEQLRRLQQEQGICLLENAENMGIATALQQGLMYAYDNGYRLLLTLDQDSRICDGALAEMLRVLNENNAIASVGPAYAPEDRAATREKPEIVKYLITSGNLIKVNEAVCCGGFDESMFIDSVDFDFSLRLRENGYLVAKAPGAHLRHSIGETYSPGGLFSFVKLEMHSPLRFYYIFRNHRMLVNRYRKSFPGFCLKKNIVMLVELLRIACFFPEKKRYFAAARKGWQDAGRGVTGKATDSF